MGVDDKQRFINQTEPDGFNEVIPDSFPGKVIPGGNGANIVISSLDKVINWGGRILYGPCILELAAALLK